jgi:adenosylhomocysteine nucleosidase
VRVLLICPIPLEYTGCRTALSLRDSAAMLGCRSARGAVGSVDILAVETGPGKARAAVATVGAAAAFQPDLVVDSGTCGALDADLIVGAIVLGSTCLEYDISGTGLPGRLIPEMKLPSALDLLPKKDAQKLRRSFTEMGKDRGLHVRAGSQACGEFLIQSTQVRETLHSVTGSTACAWETAGVFVAALRSGIPPLSIRVVSDLGDEDALRDFRRNARRCAASLYKFLRDALEAGWFASFHEAWKAAPRTHTERLAQKVLP